MSNQGRSLFTGTQQCNKHILENVSEVFRGLIDTDVVHLILEQCNWNQEAATRMLCDMKTEESSAQPVSQGLTFSDIACSFLDDTDADDRDKALDQKEDLAPKQPSVFKSLEEDVQWQERAPLPPVKETSTAAPAFPQAWASVVLAGRQVEGLDKGAVRGKPASSRNKAHGHNEPVNNDLERIKFSVWNEKILVLMRGLPGSGKSTLAKELQARGQVFSTDDFFTRGNTSYEFDPGKLSEAHSWNQRRVRKALEEGISPIIVDNTNVTRWEMVPYAVMAQSMKYSIEILEPQTPWKFQPKNLAKCCIHNVSVHTIRKMKGKYENVTIKSLLASVEHRKLSIGQNPTKNHSTDTKTVASQAFQVHANNNQINDVARKNHRPPRSHRQKGKRNNIAKNAVEACSEAPTSIQDEHVDVEDCSEAPTSIQDEHVAATFELPANSFQTNDLAWEKPRPPRSQQAKNKRNDFTEKSSEDPLEEPALAQDKHSTANFEVFAESIQTIDSAWEKPRPPRSQQRRVKRNDIREKSSEDAPEVPVSTPEVPVSTPEVPVSTPEVPVSTPEVPVSTPEVPVSTPEVPVSTPEVPVSTPEVPVSTPEVPVSTPEVPVSTPEVPVSTPEVPVSTPEVPVSTPEVPVSTPEVPVSTPEVPVSTPEVPVSTSEVPVSTPEVPVSSQGEYSTTAEAPPTVKTTSSKESSGSDISIRISQSDSFHEDGREDVDSSDSSSSGMGAVSEASAESSSSSHLSAPRTMIRRKKLHKVPFTPFLGDHKGLKAKSWKDFKAEAQILEDISYAKLMSFRDQSLSLESTKIANNVSCDTQTEGRDFSVASKGEVNDKESYKVLTANENYAPMVEAEKRVILKRQQYLDKGTQVDITVEPSAEMLYDCFPGVATAHLQEALEVCSDNVRQAADLLCEWGISIPMTSSDRQFLRRELSRQSDHVEGDDSLHGREAGGTAEKTATPKLADLCMEILQQNGGVMDIQRKIISNSKDRLNMMEQSESRRIQHSAMNELDAIFENDPILHGHSSDLTSSSTDDIGLQGKLGETSQESSDEKCQSWQQQKREWTQRLAEQERKGATRETGMKRKVQIALENALLGWYQAGGCGWKDPHGIPLYLPPFVVDNMEYLFGRRQISCRDNVIITLDLKTAQHLYRCLSMIYHCQGPPHVEKVWISSVDSLCLEDAAAESSEGSFLHWQEQQRQWAEQEILRLDHEKACLEYFQRDGHCHSHYDGLPMYLPPYVVQYLEDVYGPLHIHNREEVTLHLDLQTELQLHWCLSLLYPAEGSHGVKMFRQMNTDELVATRQLNKSHGVRPRTYAGQQDHGIYSDSSGLPHRNTVQLSLDQPVSLREVMREQARGQHVFDEQQKVREAAGDHNSIATKLKRDKLHQQFPELDKTALEEFFQINEYCYQTTVDSIEIALGSKQVQSDVMEMAAVGGQEKEDEGELYLEEKECNAPCHFEYERLRKDAAVHHSLHQDCMRQAQAHRAKGCTQVSAFYSSQAHDHFIKMERANSRASQLLLEMKQESIDSMILDLHGFRLQEAIEAIKHTIAQKERAYVQKPSLGKKGLRLYIITGRGKHSRGGVARLRPAVVKYLKSIKYKFKEENEGMYKVYLHSNPERISIKQKI